MSITVTFYSFSKRRNSTALPTSGTSSAEVSVLLKDVCSQEEPVLELASTDPDNYNSYNYVYIPFFSRYYFVKRKEVDNGSRLIVYCEEDYLGSFKSSITSITGAFIEYSSMVTNNVIDPRIPQTVAPVYTRTDATLSDTTFTENGCSVISSTGNTTSGLFILSDADDIFELFDGIDWDEVTVESSDNTATAFINTGTALLTMGEQFFTKDAATRNLRSAMSFPWVVHGDAIGSQVDNLYIGGYPTGKTVYKVANEIVSDSCTVEIPWSRANWMRCDKYTDLIIYLPLFGLVNLPVNSLIDDTSVRVTYVFSYSNGDVSYQIEGTTSNHIVAVGTTNASAPLAIGSSNINNTKLATSVATGAATVGLIAAGAITGGASIAAAAGVIGASALGAIDALGGQALGGGGFGGFACSALDTTIHLYQFTKALTESTTNMGTYYGYPRNNIGSLSDLTGYTKLNGFVFSDADATLNEADTISNQLNSGFFIE